MKPEELLSEALVAKIPAIHRWLNVGWKETMADEAVVLAGELVAASPRLAAVMELGLEPGLLELWQDYRHVTEGGNPLGLTFLQYIAARSQPPGTRMATGTNG